MPGDKILPPGRGENKDRSAIVQSNGTLLEEDAGKPWIDPVAFCVSSNDWKESATFLKDRNRIGHCTRVRGDEEGEKLSELKIEARMRNSFITPKDQRWGELLNSKLVKLGDTIRSPGWTENKGRRALVQGDGTLLEQDANTHKKWKDPVAFCVRNNGWKESATFLQDRNQFGCCTRVRGGDEDVQPTLKELTIEAGNRNIPGGVARPSSSAAPKRDK